MKNQFKLASVFYFRVSEDRRKVKNIFLHIASLFRIVKGGVI
jgi:hypothetical protein